MSTKPRTAAGYFGDGASRVVRTLLLLASRLGDLMDEMVVVGGIVPYLLVDQKPLAGRRRHVGSMDLDVGLSLAVFDQDRYRELSRRLRDCGLVPETTEGGGLRRQTWVIGSGIDAVRIDFLIGPNRQGAAPGRLTQIEGDFAAITIEHLDLAFSGRRWIGVSGTMENGASISRRIPTCGPAAFIVLKALAFRGRGENKDAYDMFYVLSELGIGEVAADFRTIAPGHEGVTAALRVLREDFVQSDFGRAQVAEFLDGNRNEAIEADVFAFVSRLLFSIR